MNVEEIKKVLAQKLGGAEAREAVEAFERLAMASAETVLEKLLDGLLESKVPAILKPLLPLGESLLTKGIESLEEKAVSATDKALKELAGDTPPEDYVANMQRIAAGSPPASLAAIAVLNHLGIKVAAPAKAA